MATPIVVPASHRMYVAIVPIDVRPSDDIVPQLVIAWALYRSEYDDFNEPNPITINGELSQHDNTTVAHFAEDRGNLFKMVKRIAENNERDAK